MQEGPYGLWMILHQFWWGRWTTGGKQNGCQGLYPWGKNRQGDATPANVVDESIPRTNKQQGESKGEETLGYRYELLVDMEETNNGSQQAAQVVASEIQA